MSYATIEEAWGGLGKQVPQSPVASIAPPPKQAKRPVEKPAPGVTFDDGRKYVRAVYAQYGLRGVMELLGEDISKRLCGNNKRKGRSAKPQADWFGFLTPEKMLLLIAVLFGAIALVDGFSSPVTSGGSPPPW